MKTIHFGSFSCFFNAVNLVIFIYIIIIKMSSFLSTILDNDTSIQGIVSEMEKDTNVFMRLMNEANKLGETDADTFNALLNEQEENVRSKICENVKRYGSNYMKILCHADTEIKNRGVKNAAVTEEKNGGGEWFFQNIIFFTNERDSVKNKTLKNLEDAIKGKNVNLVVFAADEVTYKATKKSIEISDTKTSYSIKEQSNIDTICIVRLGAQDSEQCMQCVKEIQEWGIFTVNPIGAAKIASNKYETSVLLEKYGIPQPKFALLTATDIEKGEESLINKLDIIYKGTKERFKSEDNKDREENERQKYVVKILDGHGGTGVFMLDGKSILSVLQAIFAIDPERELLLQKKEEADGGDIRVHVLSFNNEQRIIAAMKRVKLDGDFRSNVSLGASAEKVKLTKEQEEIAVKVAKISRMPWCAVDIMPLRKGSNPEIGDNVVLEYNASPGTDGISEVLGENFVEILLNNINEMKDELPLSVKQIGYIENVSFILKEGEKPVKLESKFDTGNGSKAPTLGCDKIEMDGEIVKADIKGKTYVFDISGEINPKVGQSREQRVTASIPEIIIGTRKLKNVQFGLVSNRSDKSTPVLINRDVMRKMGFVVNPNLKNSIDNM